MESIEYSVRILKRRETKMENRISKEISSKAKFDYSDLLEEVEDMITERMAVYGPTEH